MPKSRVDKIKITTYQSKVLIAKVKLLGLDPVKGKVKHGHVSQVIERMLQNYVKENEQLISTIEKSLPDLDIENID